MRYKVCDLEGALLDRAVAKAEGLTMEHANFGEGWVVIVPDQGAYFIGTPPGKTRRYVPSEDWALGGPIIERERIATAWMGAHWAAFRFEPPANPTGYDGHDYIDLSDMDHDGVGSTPLIAAMRAYVTSKIGPEVDL
jgi:hypothetical protein